MRVSFFVKTCVISAVFISSELLLNAIDQSPEPYLTEFVSSLDKRFTAIILVPSPKLPAAKASSSFVESPKDARWE